MSGLNKPTPAPKFGGDSYKVAEELMDKLFPFFHDYEPLNIHSIITESDLLDEEKNVAFHLRDKIDDLLYNKFEYADKNGATKSGYYGYLSQKGRDAKAGGGHYKYLQKLIDEKELEKKKDLYDLNVKKWTYKSRYIPYIFSFLAILVSLLVYLNNLSKNASDKELRYRQAILETKMDSITQELENVKASLKQDNLSQNVDSLVQPNKTTTVK